MVLCSCHRPAVYTPGLNSLDTHIHMGGDGVEEKKDKEKKRTGHKKNIKVKTLQKYVQQRTKESRKVALNDFASWERNQIAYLLVGQW